MNGPVQKDVVLILARELASNIATPMLLMDRDGTLVFYNEPAEVVLGAAFSQVGELPAAEWDAKWPTTDASGAPLSLLDSPLSRAITKREAAHEIIGVMGLDGVSRRLAATIYPLIGGSHRLVGAVAVFWQLDGSA